jgi:hypothetical protein
MPPRRPNTKGDELGVEIKVVLNHSPRRIDIVTLITLLNEVKPTKKRVHCSKLQSIVWPCLLVYNISSIVKQEIASHLKGDAWTSEGDPEDTRKVPPR